VQQTDVEGLDRAHLGYKSAMTAILASRADETIESIQTCIEACASAVAHDRERIADGLYETVIHRLFEAGLQLQSTCQSVDPWVQARLETTISLLDDTIGELRKAIFSLH
jgi:signal transduction histidine kinase